MMQVFCLNSQKNGAAMDRDGEDGEGRTLNQSP